MSICGSLFPLLAFGLAHNHTYERSKAVSLLKVKSRLKGVLRRSYERNKQSHLSA